MNPAEMSPEPEEEYIVEAIRDWRHNLKNNRKEYLIKWHRYDESENTWEPESNLNCPTILEEFKRNIPQEERKYFEAPDPEALSGFQRKAEFIQCIGADGPHESDDENSPKVDKQRFYCLLLFDDSDYAEEVTLKEFFRSKPEEAFAFCEGRLLRKKRHKKQP